MVYLVYYCSLMFTQDRGEAAAIALMQALLTLPSLMKIIQALPQSAGIAFADAMPISQSPEITNVFKLIMALVASRTSPSRRRNY